MRVAVDGGVDVRILVIKRAFVLGRASDVEPRLLQHTLQLLHVVYGRGLISTRH
jgi:hypothetical protein